MVEVNTGQKIGRSDDQKMEMRCSGKDVASRYLRSNIVKPLCTLRALRLIRIPPWPKAPADIA